MCNQSLNDSEVTEVSVLLLTLALTLALFRYWYNQLLLYCK